MRANDLRRRSVRVVDRSFELFAGRWERLLHPFAIERVEPSESVEPILVVDDDEATRTAFVEALALGGYRVEPAADGREALRAAAEIEPAVIVLDLGLPDLDGDVFVREWRKVVSPEHEPALVVVSGRPDAEQVTADLHPHACLEKPVGAEELLAAVDEALATAAR